MTWKVNIIEKERFEEEKLEPLYWVVTSSITEISLTLTLSFLDLEGENEKLHKELRGRTKEILTIFLNKMLFSPPILQRPWGSFYRPQELIATHNSRRINRLINDQGCVADLRLEPHFRSSILVMAPAIALTWCICPAGASRSWGICLG